MRNRTRNRIAATALIATLATIGVCIPATQAAAATPTPHSAVVTPSEYEDDTAVAGTPDFSTYYVGCNSYTGVLVCFQPHGDKIWVEDTEADGSAAFGDWVNQLLVSPDWISWRQGTCANRLGAWHWGYCNKDFYEWDSTNVYGTKGSRVAYRGETTYDVDGEWLFTNNDE